MKISHIYFCIIFLFISTNTHSQQNGYTVSGGIGIGSFMGDFPSQSTFGGKLFFETDSPITLFKKIQFHFSFAQKIEKFLPDSYTYNHYSYFTSLGLSGLFKQQLNETIFIEEGIGLIYLNDRSFDDINTWNYGILLSFISGLPLTENIDLSLNIDYGLTLNNTNSSYFLFMMVGNYNF